MKKSGVLLHISSLPNKYGIGTLGEYAYKFVDFLSKASQDYWQVLPIGPTSYKDSPYQSFSSFAGNPYFIDLDLLVAEGLLSEDDLKEANLENKTSYIDYGNLFINKIKILKKACPKEIELDEDFNSFVNENKSLIDYALYMALKEYHNFKACNEWNDVYKFKEQVFFLGISSFHFSIKTPAE